MNTGSTVETSAMTAASTRTGAGWASSASGRVAPKWTKIASDDTQPASAETRRLPSRATTSPAPAR